MITGEPSALSPAVEGEGGLSNRRYAPRGRLMVCRVVSRLSRVAPNYQSLFIVVNS